MRASLLMAALVATLGLAAEVIAQDVHASISDYTTDGGDSCSAGAGCAHGCGLHRGGCGLRGGGHRGCGHVSRRSQYDGLDRSFNCGCTGSYKFPVPPQYTYFWPGSVYSQELMTNYHSPWRFPPLKPYTEETLMPAAEFDAPQDLRPVSLNQEVAQPQLRPGQVEPMSSAMQRFFR